MKLIYILKPELYVILEYYRWFVCVIQLTLVSEIANSARKENALIWFILKLLDCEKWFLYDGLNGVSWNVIIEFIEGKVITLWEKKNMFVAQTNHLQ